MAGCLLPFVLMIVGGAVGIVLGGHTDGYIGAGIGLAVGVVAMVALIGVMALAKRR